MSDVVHVTEYRNLVSRRTITPAATKVRGNKYNNIKQEYDGMRFDSKKELEEWKRLKMLEKSGAISELKRQVRIPLVVNGEKVCVYIVDFLYYFKGELVYHDAKGKKTDVYSIKKKLLHAIKGVWIKET